MDNFVIRKSEGKGLGVFSATAFKQGDLITESTFKTISYDQSKILRKHDMEISYYMFADREGHELDPDSCDYHFVFGPMPMLNHNDRANCDLQWDKYRDIPTVKLIANQDIKEDQELFILYKNIHLFPVEFV